MKQQLLCCGGASTQHNRMLLLYASKLILLYFIVLLLPTSMLYAQDGSLDPSFSPNDTEIGQNLYTGSLFHRQTDGKIIINFFDPYQTASNAQFLRRLNSDGTLDASFNQMNHNDYIHAIKQQSDGKILLVGSFSQVGGAEAYKIARLNQDGTLDTSFSFPESIAQSIQYSYTSLLLLPDGKILLASSFLTEPNTYTQKIIRLNTNGTLDNSFPALVFNAYITQMALGQDGKLFVGGLFSSLNELPCKNFIKIDLATQEIDTSFDYAFSTSTVHSFLVAPDAKIYVASDNLVRINSDGSLDESFTQTPLSLFSGSPLFALENDGKLLVSNASASTNHSSINTSNILSRFNADGTHDQNFVVTSSSVSNFLPSVNNFSPLPDGKILVGGGFTNLNGNIVPSLVHLANDGTLDPSFAPAIMGIYREGQSLSLTKQADQKIILTGTFEGVNGKYRRGIARLHPDGAIDESFDAGFIGGFSNFGETYGIYRALPQPDGKILISGNFHLPALANNTPNFTHILARLESNGAIDESFNFDPNLDFEDRRYGTAIALLPDGKILIAAPRYNNPNEVNFKLIRLHQDGSIDDSFSTDAFPIYVNPETLTYVDKPFCNIVVQPDGKILLGRKVHSSDVYSSNLFGIVRLNADGSLDESFDAPYQGQKLMLQDDGKILVSNHSTAVNSQNAVFRLFPDGSLDDTFQTEFIFLHQNSSYPRGVEAILLQEDNQLIVAGNFSGANGMGKNGIARLNNSLSSCTFIPKPTIISQSICGEGSLTLTAEGASEGEVYVWYQGDEVLKTSLDHIDNTFTTPNLSSSQVYEVRIRNIGTDCQSSKQSVEAIINSLPPMPQAGEVTIQEGEDAILSATGATAEQIYKWYAQGTDEALYTSTSSEDNQFTVSGLASSAVFEVSIFDLVSLCESSRTSVNVIVEVPFVENNVLLPQLFSPNGDNRNDRLWVRGTNLQKVALSVFDRQGKLVYQTNNLEEATVIGWDGNDLPAGAYQAWLEAQFSNGESKTLRSIINLVR